MANFNDLIEPQLRDYAFKQYAQSINIAPGMFLPITVSSTGMPVLNTEPRVGDPEVEDAIDEQIKKLQEKGIC